jgi:Uma2 family endonuclease
VPERSTRDRGDEIAAAIAAQRERARLAGMSQAAILDERSERPMSLAEWAAMPEDEPGELVDGRLVEEEVPSYVHEIIVVWFARMLGNWLALRGGLVGGSDAKFAVKPTRGRKPDLSAYLPGSRKPPRQGLIHVPPDIMVEVVSPTPKDGRRDRVEKLKEYAAFGVRWYWLVDPQLRSLEILELGGDGRYVHALDATDGPIESVPGCEGLTLDLDALWAEADRLETNDGAEGPDPSQAPT